MHSYLLVAKSDSQADAEIKKIGKNLRAGILPFDIKGITDVKELEKYAILSQANPMLIVIKGLQNCSEEASNSLLKLIEEPGTNINFILTTDNLKSILPTIASRCQIITPAERYNPEANNILTRFFAMDVNAMFSEIDNIRSSEEAKMFSGKLLAALQQQLINKPNISKYIDIGKNALKLNKSLSQNGNATLHLARFVVAISG